jgi:hypothetical protein
MPASEKRVMCRAIVETPSAVTGRSGTSRSAIGFFTRSVNLRLHAHQASGHSRVILGRADQAGDDPCECAIRGRSTWSTTISSAGVGSDSSCIISW